MSEVKHTPGPWRKLRVLRRIGVQIGSAGGFLFDWEMPDQEANANLIAAAPDLLEALKAMVEAHAIPSTGCKSRIAYEHAIAAIAKAEGAET